MNTLLPNCIRGRHTGPIPGVVAWIISYDGRLVSLKIGTVPKGGKIVVTAGVDVQKDRLEVEVVAWGIRRENWSIDYQVLEGDTTVPKTQFFYHICSSLLKSL